MADPKVGTNSAVAQPRIDLSRLSDFFDASDIEWKPITISKKTNKGLAAAYITNRAVMDRFDAVCGPENWRNEFKAGPCGGILCGISVRIDGEWVTKWDGAENTDIEPVKGGLSNSMRRAAVLWGCGRYLYNLPSQWVPVDQYGKFLQTPRIPAHFLPQGKPVVDPNTGVVEEAKAIVREAALDAQKQRRTESAPLSEIEQILSDALWTDDEREKAREFAKGLRSQRDLDNYAKKLRKRLKEKWADEAYAGEDWKSVDPPWRYDGDGASPESK